MSSILKWTITEGDSLPDELKQALEKGKIINTSPTIFDSKDIHFLQGLACADVVGAQELIDLILEHGKVELWLEY